MELRVNSPGKTGDQPSRLFMIRSGFVSLTRTVPASPSIRGLSTEKFFDRTQDLRDRYAAKLQGNWLRRI